MKKSELKQIIKEELLEAKKDKTGLAFALAANIEKYGKPQTPKGAKKVGETNEVQKDFELICFDLVSSPSTPGAYLFLNKDDRMNYEENLDEEKKMQSTRSSEMDDASAIDKSKKLMDKLSAFLDK